MTTTENFPKLIKGKQPQIQEAQNTSRRITFFKRERIHHIQTAEN